MTLVFAGVIDAFTAKTQNRMSDAEFDHELKAHVLYFVYLSIGMFITSYLQMVCFDLASARQTTVIRKLFLSSILRQNRTFFDTHNAGELSSRLTSDIELIQNGTGEKVGLFIQAGFTLVAAIAISVSQSWKVTLVLGCLFPFMGACSVICNRIAGKKGIASLKAYAQASNVVEETLSSIRTVMALNGQNRASQTFAKQLKPAKLLGVQRAKAQGLGVAGVQTCMYLAYSIAFFYGSYLITKGELTPGRLMAVYFALVIGTMRMSSVAPELAAFSNACSAASAVFELIDREPEDVGPLDKDVPLVRNVNTNGSITFENVTFAYPSRPSVKVLDNFSLEFEPGKTTALVGQSGSGKSTIVALLERWYEPSSGIIKIDGIPLRNHDLKSLRNSIGIVSQEPILFDLTIAENIALGAAEDSPPPTHEQIVAASTLANAHSFVMKMPLGYDTIVGERGALLSGGQKQRIAIARAVVRDPKILLMDEATSALDSSAERQVQEGLDRAASGRTVITVAHRLSTIRNAEKIVVMNQGLIVQVGDHKSLLEVHGPYKSLVEMQKVDSDDKTPSTKDEKRNYTDDDDDVVVIQSVPDAAADSQSPPLPATLKRLTSTISRASSGKKGHDIETASVAISEVDPRSEQFYQRLWKLHRPEARTVLLGMCGAVLSGAIFPVYAILYGYILQVFAITDLEEMRRQANGWAGAFLALAVCAGLGNYAVSALFGATSERVTTRLRQSAFDAMLQQEPGWFDREDNRTGTLVAQIATDTARVNVLVGSVMGTLLQLAVNLVGCLLVSFIVSWKTTVVIVAVIPMLIASGMMQMASLKGFGAKTQKAHAQAASVATQAIQNHATVISLGREKTFLDKYNHALKGPDKAAHSQAFVTGLGYAASNGLGFLANALAFYWGGTLFLRGEIGIREMFTVMIAIVFGSMASGRASGFVPDVAKAKHAAKALFTLLDRTTRINVHAAGLSIAPAPAPLSISFRDVSFAYPTRADHPVLKHLDLEIEHGTCVALVGPSGGGKSTVLALLERFYDPDSGSVCINDTPLTALQLEEWRSQIGYVGQEPVLFDATIRDNIAYGSLAAQRRAGTDPCPTSVTDLDIIRAAQDANIHDFITRLPLQYDTPVGSKASQLSGGQRQRIAIARAIIQNPRLLLLDEATSALDSESEKLIQDALERLLVRRTAVVIAHRLSTIMKSDKIVVIEAGRSVEAGTHAQLVAEKGVYANLVALQNLTA
ncbi:multidrug resistance protein 1a [Powellomyces hirtus]|nr:multidrug resistance protein 1a [Powellomyces hirtus]